MDQLEAGDVVVLKSGGPKMTIRFIESSEAACIWFIGTKKSEARFPLSTLEKSVPPSIEVRFV